MKKLCSLLICMVITLTLCSAAFAERSYLKGASDWAKEEIINARGVGILDWGMNVTEDEWTRNITRSMVASFIAKYCFVTGNVPEKVDYDPFEDTDSQSVKLLYALGIIKGVSGNSFQPWREITREELAVMLERTLLLSVDESELQVIEETPIEGVSPWAQKAVQTMYKYGVFKNSDTSVNYQGNVTWEETVVTLWRIFRYTSQGKTFLTYGETTPEILIELGIVSRDDFEKGGYITNEEALTAINSAQGIEFEEYMADKWKDYFDKEEFSDEAYKERMIRLYCGGSDYTLTYSELLKINLDSNLTNYEAIFYLTRMVQDNPSCLAGPWYPDPPRSYVYEQAVEKDFITSLNEETADEPILRKDFYNLLHKALFTEYIAPGFSPTIERHIDRFQIKNQ